MKRYADDLLASPGDISVAKNTVTDGKPIIRTHFMGSLAVPELNPFPSMTIPDQALTIKQILERHASGRPFTDHKTPMYDGDTDPTGLNGRDFRTLDLSEKHELILANRERITELTNLINEQAIERKKKADQPAAAPPTVEPIPGDSKPTGETES